MNLTKKVDDFRTAFHVIKKEVDDFSTEEIIDRLNELEEDIKNFNSRLKRDFRSAAFQERIDELAYLRRQVVKFRQDFEN